MQGLLDHPRRWCLSRQLWAVNRNFNASSISGRISSELQMQMIPLEKVWNCLPRQWTMTVSWFNQISTCFPQTRVKLLPLGFIKVLMSLRKIGRCCEEVPICLPFPSTETTKRCPQVVQTSPLQNRVPPNVLRDVPVDQPIGTPSVNRRGKKTFWWRCSSVLIDRGEGPNYILTLTRDHAFGLGRGLRKCSMYDVCLPDDAESARRTSGCKGPGLGDS